jgi:hypothetical protein
VKDGVLKLNPTFFNDSSSRSSIVFSIGGVKGRVEAALGQVGAGDGVDDRLFAAEKGLEECGNGSSVLAAVERRERGASSGVQVWGLGEGGGLLCEVAPCAGQGRIQCWDSFLGNGRLVGVRGGGNGVFCWLISADSSGAIVYLDLSPAAAAVASVASSAAVLPLTPIPQLIRSLDLASKLQALPGHASTHAACCASHTPQRYRCTPHVSLSSSSSSSSQTNVESRCQKGKGAMKSMLFYLLHFDASLQALLRSWVPCLQATALPQPSSNSFLVLGRLPKHHSASLSSICAFSSTCT